MTRGKFVLQKNYCLVQGDTLTIERENYLIELQSSTRWHSLNRKRKQVIFEQTNGRNKKNTLRGLEVSPIPTTTAHLQ